MAIWGRKDQEEPRPPVQPAREQAVATPQPAAAPVAPAAERGSGMSTVGTEGRKAIIGPSIHVKGELIGNEDLVIEGRVEGVVRLRDHHLTIGKSAHIQATLEAKSIRVEGTVQGDVMAGERVELSNGSALSGDIVAPRIIIADGARFKGSVDMDKNAPPRAGQPSSAQQTQPVAAGAGANRPAGVTG